MGENNEEKIDYLEVDEPIPGQNYVCLSFVSPDSLIESKEAFKVSKFLQSVCKDKDMDFKSTMEKYKDFCYKFSDNLQKDFDEQNEFKTNIRGLKVRGTYNTRDEAERRAKKLQGLDSDFHVFVGQVGYWLPWDPTPHQITNQEYFEKELNELVKKYNENQEQKQDHFRENIDYVKEQAAKKVEEEKSKKNQENIENSLENVDPWLSSKENSINSSETQTL